LVKETINTVNIKKINIHTTDKAFTKEEMEQICKPYGIAQLTSMLPSNIPMCIWSYDDDKYISRTLEQGLVWEPFLMQFMDRHIKDEPPSVVIDAGAQIGQYGLHAAARGHYVYAFEPMPQHIEIITKTLQLNPDIASRYTLFANALSYHPGHAYLHINKKNKGGSNVFYNKDAAEYVQEVVEVSVITLDNILPIIQHEHPDKDVIFLKADIEGYEPAMLKGGQQFFATYSIDSLIMEFRPPHISQAKCDSMKTLKALEALDYIITNEGRKFNESADLQSLSLDLIIFRHDKQLQ